MAKTGLNANVLLAQQTTGQNFERAVFGERVARVQGKAHTGLKCFVVKDNLLDPANNDPGAFHGSPRLEAANVVEPSAHFVIRVEIERQQVS